MINAFFEANGYWISPPVVDQDQLDALAAAQDRVREQFNTQVGARRHHKAGTVVTLSNEPCRHAPLFRHPP